MRFPKVSVAVVAYNHREFIGECLESILQQQYANIEIVIADDHSSDGTLEIVDRYAKHYPGIIKVVQGDTRVGVTGNCNRALSACTGEYISWLGGDDLMLPGKINAQVAIFEQDPSCVLVYHDLDVFDSSTGRSLYRYNGRFRADISGKPCVESLVEGGTYCGACSVMVRRSATPRHGFDSGIPVASDWLFWVETAVNGSICFIPEVLGRYRRHMNNVTNTVDLSFVEPFLTLDLIEQRYPGLVESVRISRGRIYAIQTVRYLRLGQLAIALGAFKRCLDHGGAKWFHRLAIKKVLRFLTPHPSNPKQIGNALRERIF